MTMQLIETKTVGTAVASVEFTSIPQTYTDLLVFLSLRTNNEPDSNGYGVAEVAFNGLTTNRSNRRLVGDGGGGALSFSSSDIRVYVSGNTNTANTFGNASIYIPNYTSAVAKSISLEQVTENNATRAYIFLMAGLYDSTAALTSITFTALSSGQFVANSSISLYGILKGSDGIVTTS
jgi:hypothetical protein